MMETVTLALPEPLQRGQDALALGAVRLALDPTADGVPVLARGQLHRDQNISLRQYVLVQHGRTLGDQPGHEAPDAPAAHDLLDPPQQRLAAGLGPLRRPQVGASSSTRCNGSVLAS